MNDLIQRWGRALFYPYYEALDPIDRATFWIVAALALISALSVDAVFR